MTKQIIMMSREERYKLFVKWSATPKETKLEQNIPTSMSSFAIQYQIPITELEEFNESDNFPDDVEREAIRWGKRRLPELIHLTHKKYLETNKVEYLKVFRELISTPPATDTGDRNQFNFFNLDEKTQKEFVQRLASKKLKEKN